MDAPGRPIQTKTEKIAVELDHGKSLGDWASKLLKAVRLAASPKISGVLFCYFTPCDQRKWFVGGNFTPEFCKILDNGASKPVSIITIGKEFDSVKL
ncbi:MAG: hypothetical protein M1548_03740 [Actinobacteria bacterium]|nr:hypothetical protein [Actinomycetota bacterium]